MEIKAIIFDCVGPLLIRNENIVFDNTTSTINGLCGKVTDEEAFWETIQKTYHLNDSQLKNLIKILIEGYKKNIPMWDFLFSIKGKYKIGLINNGTSVIYNQWSTLFKFEEIFDKTFNSSLLGIRKPDVRIYQQMTKLLKVDPNECVFIDDSEINVTGAISAGMKGIVYNPNKHEQFLQQIKLYI
jgi:FMN phosphatase YigB (HAD superfamily)